MKPLCCQSPILCLSLSLFKGATGYLTDKESVELSVPTIAGKTESTQSFSFRRTDPFLFARRMCSCDPFKHSYAYRCFHFLRGRGEFNMRVLPQSVDAISLFWLAAQIV